MKYEKPNIEVMKMRRLNVICDSGLFGVNENEIAVEINCFGCSFSTLSSVK